MGWTELHPGYEGTFFYSQKLPLSYSHTLLPISSVFESLLRSYSDTNGGQGKLAYVIYLFRPLVEITLSIINWPFC